MVNSHTESNTSNFKLILDNDLYGSVERYCQSFVTPSISINNVESRIGYIDIQNIGDRIRFDRIRFEILLDKGIDSYLEILNMMFEQVDQDSGVVNAKKAIFDTKLLVLDNQRQPIYEFKYTNSFFTKIDNIVFDHRKTEFITFGLEMAFETMKVTNLVRSSV